MKTTMPKDVEADRAWFVVDAEGKPAGRLAVEIANILRGKNKPVFAPHLDTGDFVVVINAEKVALTGTKEDTKLYQKYTGYTNSLRKAPARTIREKDPKRIIHQAVKGMLPHNRMGRHLMTRLKIYTGPEHPHAAQQPQTLELCSA